MINDMKICEWVEHFSGVSGIGLFCLDKDSNRRPQSTARWKDADLKLLAFAEVIERIQALPTSSSESDCSYETFFTLTGFVYNIHRITQQQVHIGTLVTEPMLIQQLDENKIQAICVQRGSSIAEKILFRNILLHVPVVSWQRVSQLGKVLQSMCCASIGHHHVRQISSDIHGQLDQQQEIPPKTSPLPTQVDFGQLPSEDRYQQIRHVIQTGDLSALKPLLNHYSLTDCPVNQNPDIDFIRSAKNSSIVTCTMACFCAIEAGYPYDQAITLAQKLIDGTERLQDVNAIFSKMKDPISDFTAVVGLYKDKTYSKTMHKVLLFIQSRYQEKISLKEIAEYVGHHPNYLSSLVKKETGLPLFEHINRVRVEMSKYELQHTTRTIAEIAQNAGFSHQNYYARIFKRMTGVTPSEFRSKI